MTNSSHDRFGVFEFREEDEMVGIMDVKLQSRLNQPKFCDSPSLKYDFLACVARGSNIHAKGSVGVDCVDVDSIDDDDDDQHCSVGVAMQTLSIPLEDAASKPFLDNDSAAAAALEQTCQFHADFYVNKSLDSNVDGKSLSPGSCTPENGHDRSSQMESPTHSDTTNSTGSNPVLKRKDSPSLSPGDVHAEANGFRGLNMESEDNAVALQADYVVYKGNIYPSALITFSDRSIKIESPVMVDDHDLLMLQWEIDDVVTIESQSYNSCDLVKVQIHVLSKATVQKETIHDASGVEECKVMLFDPDWCLSLQKIMSLNVRFKATWKTLASSDVADGDSSPVDKSEPFLGLYFPKFAEHFDEVVFPEGDADAVFIGKRDVELLQPGAFINDTIIDFYIQYLKKKIPAKELCRFHFFNSFFFRKLADLDKNPDSALDGKAAFQRVRKWTRKLNLFEKDYLFIPVNYGLHWSLIVVCHPAEVADFTAEKMNGSSRVPCILHMDSIRGTHAGLKNLLQSYLAEEWRERQKETSEDVSLKFSNLRFLSLELPQQRNFYDCGLFLLHYVELFVKEAPVNFNPFNIDKFSNFLTADWFMPDDVSLKRAQIQRLIREIVTNRSKGTTGNSVDPDGTGHRSSKLDEDHAHDNGIELISASCGVQSTPLDSLYPGSHQGNDMDAQWRPPLGSSQFASEPDLTLGDLFEPGTSSTPLFDQYQRHDLGSYGHPKGTMSPIEEEDVEANADPLCSASGGSSLRQLDGLTSEGCVSGYFRTASWDQDFDLGEHEVADDSSQSSESDSDGVEVIVYTPPDSAARTPPEDSPPNSYAIENEPDDRIPPFEDDVEVLVHTPPDSAARRETTQTPEDSSPDSDAIENEPDDRIPPFEDDVGIEVIVHTPQDSPAPRETTQTPEDSSPDSDAIESERESEDDVKVEVIVHTPPDSAAPRETTRTLAEDSSPDSDTVKSIRDDHIPSSTDEGSDESQPAKRLKLSPTESEDR